MGPDSYFISEDTGFGSTSVSKIKADAFREAGEFCTGKGKYFMVTHTQDVPFAFGRPAHSEVQFMCLNKDDPQLQRVRLENEPTTKIEVRTPATQGR